MPRGADQPPITISRSRRRSLMVWFPEGRRTLWLAFGLALPLTFVVCCVIPLAWSWGLLRALEGHATLEAVVAYVVFLVCWAVMFWTLDLPRTRRLRRVELSADRIELRGQWRDHQPCDRSASLAQVGHVGLNSDNEFVIAFGTAEQPSLGPRRVPLEATTAEDQFDVWRENLKQLVPGGLYSILEQDHVVASRPWHLAELFPRAGVTRVVTARRCEVGDDAVDVETDARAYRYDGPSGVVCERMGESGNSHDPAILRIRRDFATCPRGMIFARVERGVGRSFTLQVDAANTLEFDWSERRVHDAEGRGIGAFQIGSESTVIEFDEEVSETVAILGALFLGSGHACLRVPDCAVRSPGANEFVIPNRALWPVEMASTRAVMTRAGDGAVDPGFFG